jgi:amino acid permease
MRKLIYAIFTLSGTIIGVGIFSLPFVTLKVGFFSILFYFLFLGVLVTLIHLIFGEIALKTPDYKRLPGFCSFYLGKFGEKIAYLSTIFGTFGAILAYLIAGGEFLSQLLSPIFGGGNFFWTIIYFLIGALLIFFGIKVISKIEFWGLALFFTILIIIFLKERSLIQPDNLFIGQAEFKRNFFLPYGPILFSLWGASLIPEIEEMLKDRKDQVKKAILIAMIIPIVVYFFFIYLVLGMTGSNTTESALSGLKNVLPNKFFYSMIFGGIITTLTSFIALGLTLRNVFWYDLKINKNLSFLSACFPPLFLYLIGVDKFLPVISFVGSVMLGFDGILILLIYLKIQRSKIKGLMVFPLFLVLILGIIYQVFYFLK